MSGNCHRVVAWIRNASYSLVSLNTWFPVGGAVGEVMEPLRGGAFSPWELREYWLIHIPPVELQTPSACQSFF